MRSSEQQRQQQQQHQIARFEPNPSQIPESQPERLDEPNPSQIPQSQPEMGALLSACRCQPEDEEEEEEDVHVTESVIAAGQHGAVSESQKLKSM